MNRLSLALAFSVALSAAAQQKSTARPFRFTGAIQKTIDVSKMKAGDVIVLHTVGCLKRDGKHCTIPAGANIIAHVTVAAAYDRSTKLSRFSLATDRIEWNGHSMPLPATVQSVYSYSTQEAARGVGDIVRDTRLLGVDSDGAMVTGARSFAAERPFSHFEEYAVVQAEESDGCEIISVRHNVVLQYGSYINFMQEQKGCESVISKKQ
jgi:hypothetical protein